MRKPNAVLRTASSSGEPPARARAGRPDRRYVFPCGAHCFARTTASGGMVRRQSEAFTLPAARPVCSGVRSHRCCAVDPAVPRVDCDGFWTLLGPFDLWSCRLGDPGAVAVRTSTAACWGSAPEDDHGRSSGNASSQASLMVLLMSLWSTGQSSRRMSRLRKWHRSSRMPSASTVLYRLMRWRGRSRSRVRSPDHAMCSLRRVQG